MSDSSPRRRSAVVIGLFFVAVGAVAIAGWQRAWIFPKQFGERCVIGVSLPLSGPKKEAGVQILNALQLNVDERNANGGAGGRRLQLLVKDDANDPAKGAENARSFAGDPRVVAVIGHYDASVALRAREAYDRAGLVIFSPSVSSPDFSHGSRWAFSGTYSDDRQAQILAAYLSAVKDHHNVVLFHGTDPYGVELEQAFTAEARKIGLTTRVFSYENAVNAISSDWVRSRVPDASGVDAFVLLSHSVDGAELIRQIRGSGFATPIYGSDRIATGLLERIPRDTEQLHVSFPFTFDFASLKAREFARHYEQRFKAQPSLFACFAYDGVSLIANAIAERGPAREAIRAGLAAIDSDARSVEGASGRLVFDAGRNMQRPVVMTRLRAGELRPTLVQLREVTNRHGLEQVPELVAKGSAVVVGGTPYYRVNVVYVGVDLYHINAINIVSQSFDAEYFLWFKWRGEMDVENIAVINEINASTGEGGNRTLLRKNFPPEHAGDPEPELKWASYKVKGTYTQRFDLHDFPFDTQRLSLVFAHSIKNANKIQFVQDREVESAEALTEYPLEWRAVGRDDFAGTFNYHSTFGNPSYRKGESQSDFSVAQTDLVIHRVLFPYLVTLFLPLFILIGISLTVVLIPMDDFYSRSGLVLTSLLGILVEHMTEARSMPQVGYLLRADHYYVASYVLLFVLVVGVNIVNMLVARQKLEPAARWDRVFGIVFLLGTIVVFAVITVWAWASASAR